MGEMTTKLALLEVLDRDGSVRHSVAVSDWPLRVGRALDNDLVLDDPHIAAHHFSIEAGDNGDAEIRVGETRNGVQLGHRRLAAGERHSVGDQPLPLSVGRVHLRLRLASQPLPPEQALLATPTFNSGWLSLWVPALLVVFTMVFGIYLETEPDGFVRMLGTSAISAIAGLLGWCGLWTLLSKVFTRQGHFGWHLRVALIATIAWEAVTVGSNVLAFSLSWAWLSDFNFVPSYLILGTMLFFHLQAVEPHRPGVIRAMAGASAAVGIALSLWFNWQGSDRFGSELYMNHLFPPSLRLAKPVGTTPFIDGMKSLQTTLDEKAKKVESDEGGGED